VGWCIRQKEEDQGQSLKGRQGAEGAEERSIRRRRREGGEMERGYQPQPTRRSGERRNDN